MNAKTLTCALALALAFTGCGGTEEPPDPSHPLIGRWERDGWTMHFRPDGTLQKTSPSRPFSGSYRLLARSRVEIDMHHMRPDEKTVWAYSVGDNRLVLTCENFGAVRTLDRAK